MQFSFHRCQVGHSMQTRPNQDPAKGSDFGGENIELVGEVVYSRVSDLHCDQGLQYSCAIYAVHTLEKGLLHLSDSRASE